MCYRRMQLNNYIPISWDSTVYLCPTIFRVVRLKRIKRIYNFQNCHVAILISQAGSHSLRLLRILRYHPGSAGGTAGDSDGVSHFAPLYVHTHHNAVQYSTVQYSAVHIQLGQPSVNPPQTSA